MTSRPGVPLILSGPSVPTMVATYPLHFGLEAASHLVRLHYALTRALGIRVETTGDTSNVGVNFRRSWD